jgi:hypothetical protein
MRLAHIDGIDFEIITDFADRVWKRLSLPIDGPANKRAAERGIVVRTTASDPVQQCESIAEEMSDQKQHQYKRRRPSLKSAPRCRQSNRRRQIIDPKTDSSVPSVVG